MTTDPHTEWDYATLMEAIAYLECKAESLEHNCRGYKTSRDASHVYRHAVAFIEHNMREMNVVSPAETYFTMK